MKKLTEKKQQALDRMIERFQAGEVAPLVAVAGIGLAEDAPARNWSYRNRVLATATTGGVDADCRGYRQWQEVGRQVQKAEDVGSGGLIYIPIFKKKENEDGEEKHELATFRVATVFGYSQTKPADDAEAPLTYGPSEPPPLADAAERLGVAVQHAPLPNAHGAYSPQKNRITVGTEDAYAFFHELAHAAEARVNGNLKPGQDPGQETRAELAAAVLADLYGQDYTGNAWEYVKHYNPGSPLKAIQRAADEVGPILELILKEADHAGD